MRIQLSDERQEMLEMVRQSAKDFAEKNIRPHVMEWDESQHFPVPLFKEMGAKRQTYIDNFRCFRSFSAAFHRPKTKHDGSLNL